NEFSLVNALGASNGEILCNLEANRSPGMESKPGWLTTGREAVFGGLTSELEDDLLDENEDIAHLSRNNKILIKCIRNKREEFFRLLSQYPRDRIAVILGTSTSGSDEADHYLSGRPQSFNFNSYAQELGDPARYVSKRLNLKGPSYTVSTACTSTSAAFCIAHRLIESDIVDAAITGGADTFARMTINGFDSLGLLSSKTCRPFARNRKGLTIGEGGGLFFLSKKESGIAFLGYGETTDGYHMTAPDPTGSGLALAMEQALKMANLKASEITYLNLHGTATPLNDASEAKAAKQVFGSVPASSTKNLTGHNLGSCGATEAGLLCLLLSSTNLKMPAQSEESDYFDPSIPEFGLLKQSTILDKGPMMSNNVAFGGNNVSLILGPS
ncbi:MAG: beta-ketoacyl-ACP synthase, partial [Burkholderiales bacterium]|nr:beta-ketoacyl-ACP synthase [Burkholderiales bacterium]